MNCCSMKILLSCLCCKLMQFISNWIRSSCLNNSLLSLLLFRKIWSATNDSCALFDCNTSLIQKSHFHGPDWIFRCEWRYFLKRSKYTFYGNWWIIEESHINLINYIVSFSISIKVSVNTSCQKHFQLRKNLRFRISK